MRPFLQIERHDNVMLARLDRPDDRNVISTNAYCDEFVSLGADIASDPSVRVLVVTGNGSAFCAGGNVKDMRDRCGMFGGSPLAIRNSYRAGIQRIPATLYDLEVPVIAAINGAAIGAGLDLACACDIRIASESAIFAESFVKLGLIPGDGGAWLLPRVIGMPRASLMTFTGEAIDASKALEYGLVAEVVPPEQLLSRAMEIASSIAANPGHATRMAKRLLHDGQDIQLAAMMELCAAYQSIAHNTGDHAEAMAARFENRDPHFADG